MEGVLREADVVVFEGERAKEQEQPENEQGKAYDMTPKAVGREDGFGKLVHGKEVVC